jgi:hypothetical protein
MIRLILGIFIEVISSLLVLGTVTGYSSKEDPIEDTIMLSIMAVILFTIGTFIIRRSIKMFIARESVLNIAIKSHREKGSIDYLRIKEELNIDECEARQYILWGYKRQLFFEIHNNKFTQPKDLLKKG